MTARKKASRPAAPPDPYPLVVETFRPFDGYDARQFADSAPSCFNGYVRIHRYRITVERIEEPAEVIAERLRKLWRGTRNHHQYGPLRSTAKRMGVELDHGEFGADVKEKP